MDRHRLAEATSIAMHKRIATLARSDHRIIDEALERVHDWARTGDVHPFYRDQWIRALEGPLDDLCSLLVDESESARALRQVSPFAGVLQPRERWEIWKRVRRSEGEVAEMNDAVGARLENLGKLTNRAP